MEYDIASLLSKRGFSVGRHAASLTEAQSRAPLTRQIADSFRQFEIVRDALVREEKINSISPDVSVILSALDEYGMIYYDSNYRPFMRNSFAKRYMRGGWLEEYAALAAEAAGAHEVIIGQEIKWSVGPFQGVNEIDSISRFNDRLAFFSSKAFRSTLRQSDHAHRKSMMNALHEADNVSDHFGFDNSKTFLLITTDLVDNVSEAILYEQLHGKALALDVELIDLDAMRWDAFVKKIATVMG